jgi:hypothetical protein
MKKITSIAIEEVRCGKFAAQIGFLTIHRVANWQHQLGKWPPAKDEHDPRTEMPIIAWSWCGSGYEPVFQSLN